MKVYLDWVGCKLNEAELERYAAQLRMAGHDLVPSPEEADLVIVNTCAVTGEAASDSRGKIRNAARRSNARIVATGCWATLDPSSAATLPNVEWVINNLDKDDLVSQVLDLESSVFDQEPIARQPLPGAHSRTRSFIKVQDGCDNFCTYCITRLARGKGRSRLAGDVLRDVLAAQAGGVQEVVLTGVHLGSWGSDFPEPGTVADLVRFLLAETDIPRIRLSSIEPWDLEEDFWSLWENGRICRHVHLPLQSGSSAVLKRMARKVTPESFFAMISDIRRSIPQMAITTDVIAGFPGETNAEFEETLQFVEKVQFSGGHVFTFSPRPGTAAERMPDPVPMPVRKERNARLRALFASAVESYHRQFIGEVLPVLWESTDLLGAQGWRLHGLTGNNLRVTALAPQRLWNQITPVHLDALTPDGLSGVILWQGPDQSTE